jgi:hypothetical protein
LIAAALPLVLTGCRADQLAFRADVPVSILAPTDRARVTLPLQVSLATTTDLVNRQRSHADLPLFAVFVDQEPMPVGETLRWVARDDKSCREAPGCPDVGYLASRAIYLTNSTSVSVDTVLTSPRGRKLSEGLHQLTVVVLDDRGRRMGEPVASRVFFVDKRIL